MKFRKDVLQELTILTPGDGFDGFECIVNDIVDVSRWSIIHHQVFKYQGKYYSTSYSNGATEMQDESPYEYEDDEIECKEVEPYEKVIIGWKDIGEENHHSLKDNLKSEWW